MGGGHRPAAGLSIAAGIALTVVAVGSSSRAVTGSRPADETCISCHVDTLNRGLSRQYQHPPFFDHGCPICHLPDAAGVPQQGILGQPAGITGTAASQEPVWTKRTVLPSASTKTADHVVVLTGLSPDERYRFRIVLSEGKDRSRDATSTSLWLTLAPKEVASSHELALPPPAFAGSGEKPAGPVTLSFLGEDGLYVRWQTAKPVFGWVELEKTEAAPVVEGGAPDGNGDATPSARTALSTPTTHPVLREPEDAAIDLCYSCHPSSAMGTSHPVRVYAAGGEIRVPDDLPTVNGGMITCVTCHDPHGADGKHLVRETIETKLCVACHSRFAGTSRATIF